MSKQIDFGVKTIYLKANESSFGHGDDLKVIVQDREIGKGKGTNYRKVVAETYTVCHGNRGMSCADNPQLAKRLVNAIKAGYSLNKFLGRTLNADLKKLGF